MNQISQGERVVIVGAGIIGIACAFSSGISGNAY
jgi:thioredoxin reductase